MQRQDALHRFPVRRKNLQPAPDTPGKRPGRKGFFLRRERRDREVFQREMHVLIKNRAAGQLRRVAARAYDRSPYGLSCPEILPAAQGGARDCPTEKYAQIAVAESVGGICLNQIRNAAGEGEQRPA